MVTWSDIQTDATTSATIRASHSTTSAATNRLSGSAHASSVNAAVDETIIEHVNNSIEDTNEHGIATASTQAQKDKPPDQTSNTGAANDIQSTSNYYSDSQASNLDRYSAGNVNDRDEYGDDNYDDEDGEDEDGQTPGLHRKLRLVGRNFISRWLFIPVFSLLRYSQKHNLTLDVFRLPSSESARHVAKRLEKQITREFNQESKSKNRDSKK
jgi:hypothetical protein